MSSEPEDIVLRYLRRLDERTMRIEDSHRDMATDLCTLKGHMTSFLQSEAGQD